jgi:Family of unknown function (DUF6095)
MPTNKKILSKGVQYLSGSLPLFFIGPSVIYSANKNKENDYYLIVLIIGILFCLGAMLLMFLGIKTIMKSMFDK